MMFGGDEDDCDLPQEDIIPGDNDKLIETNEPPYNPGQAENLNRIPAQPGQIPVIPPANAPV